MPGWQVYITNSGFWSDVIAQDNTFYLAKDLDGVNVFVLKNGQEQLRYVG